ncbi:MAG: LacI family transcriptional regulator [Oscillospiraceae bacterium]|nr:LacI family transcriptional regulator [Oscillospiraceae bacterium]
MPVTIHDVAREAGTTIGTVSKALNNSHSISGERTVQIKTIAERLGYRPNARAQTFARQANREIVFLTGLPRDIAFANPHMFEILAGAEAALTSKGYGLKLRGCGADTVCSMMKDVMERKLADGLLLHASIVTRELAVHVTHTETPHLVIGKPGFSSSLCWIDNNNQLAGELAAGYLLDSGKRKIAYIGGGDEDRISQDRLEGVKVRIKESRMCLDPSLVFKGESTMAEGTRITNGLLSRVPDAAFDSVICANNLLAFGCLNALQARGVRVPEDIALITFDDHPLAQLTNPMMTTVSIDMYDLGEQAGKLLLSKIRKPQMQIQTYTTIPRLVVRGSTASAP